MPTHNSGYRTFPASRKEQQLGRLKKSDGRCGLEFIGGEVHVNFPYSTILACVLSLLHNASVERVMEPIGEKD
jgi:hypothetical protein